MDYSEMRRRIRDTAVKAYAEGLVAGTSGNVSEYDRATGVMAITPTNLSYSVIEPSDIVMMQLDGTVVEGSLKPSSEWRLHAEIYRKMNHVSAVIHTHSPHATSFAVLQKKVPLILVEMLPFLGGEIPVAEFALPGTPEVGTNAVEAMIDPPRNACLLANHGVAIVGKNLDQTYLRALYVEDAATIYHKALQVGSPLTITPEAEKAMREKYRIPR